MACAPAASARRTNAHALAPRRAMPIEEPVRTVGGWRAHNDFLLGLQTIGMQEVCARVCDVQHAFLLRLSADACHT